MKQEIITDNDEMVIRRQVLAPGEAMPWHTDPCRRFSVVVSGARLAIEYRDGEIVEFDVHPGEAGWDEPTDRVHRAVNRGEVDFEEVVTFYRTSADQDPQPVVE